MRLPRPVGVRLRFPWRVASGALVLVLALVAGTVPRRLPAGESTSLQPAVGRLLVARAGLPDPNFFEAVVLLLDYEEDGGAVGVVINRQSGLAVGEAAPPSAGLVGRDDRLYLGGPVALDTLIVLVAEEDAPPAATPVLPGVAVVRSGPGLNDLLAGNPPAPSVRFYVGYAGWAPGQLESEISRGVWNLMPGDSRWVFDERPDEAWERLVGILFGPRA